ncbi:hypothetical protein H2198_008670 [Neophaeococcomyces mojaviensis]|uniref:Uncharacterized protein n=1 Tax=Neophaeococcomyces mojaviensis TaxID=3383035 RepID=A0ACC2ZWU2_9EURO|nr:hypothetical protein H2198_008670 [Knufia sp. JES_112]
MAVLPDDHIRLISIRESTANDNFLLSREHIHRLLPSTADLRNGNEVNYGRFALPSYVALSYTWGEHLEDVICDGATFTVSSNLQPALRALHKQFPHRLVWTDSLSINQADLGEKSYQVGIMGRIYSQAETVAVWLGEGNSSLYEEISALADTTQSDEAASTKRVDLIHKLSVVPWFYRVWTFQEIRLAKNAVVLTDSQAVPWRDFIAKVQVIRSLEPRLSTVAIRSQPRSYSPFTYAHKDRFFAILEDLNTGKSEDLTDLLFVTWYRDATEKRDKVYSLLSSDLLAAPDHGINIDYEINWSKLCIKTARASINAAQNLRVLKVAGMIRRWKSPLNNKWDPSELQQLLSHPSWAPDWWHPPQQTRSRSSLLFDERGIFTYLNFLCPDKPPQQRMDDSSPFLVLEGVFLGLINCGIDPSYLGGPVLVHAAPPCTNLIQAAVHDPADQTRFIYKANMPHFIAGIDQHLHGGCPCISFSQRRNQPFSRLQFSTSPVNANSRLKFGNNYFTLRSTPRPADLAENQYPAEVLAESAESGDWLVLLAGGGQPCVLRPVKDLHGRIPAVHEFQNFSAAEKLPFDAGMFVLVGEASMNFDQLWPGRWIEYCRAGTFVIV